MIHKETPLDKKNIAWIDTIRVLASFLIILAHYAMCVEFDNTRFLHPRSFEAAMLGVALFFAISGYLIPPSLKRTPSLRDFYKRKMVRLIVPFVACYVVLSAAMSFFVLVEPKIAEMSPFYVISNGGKLISIFIAMIPFDLNIIYYFDLPRAWFTGEWFMGTMVWLYLLSPFLNKGAEKFPVVSLTVSIALAWVIYYATAELSVQGKILGNWSLFIVRIPEFLFGMILFIHREKLLPFRRILVPGVALYLAVLFAIFMLTYPPRAPMAMVFKPQILLVTLPLTYLFFHVAEVLNERGSRFLTWFNGFNSISYMMMLIQHVVIYAFERCVPFGNLNSFGRIYILWMITLVIILASRRLKACSDPVETYLLRRP